MNKTREAKQLPPREFDAVVTYRDRLGNTWTVAAEFKSLRGRAELFSLLVTPQEGYAKVTNRLLRELPLEKLFRSLLAVENERLQKYRESREGSKLHQGREHLESELEEVGRLYIQAHLARKPTQAAVATALGISISTAAKRIMAARRRGLLPPIDDVVVDSRDVEGEK